MKLSDIILKMPCCCRDQNAKKPGFLFRILAVFYAFGVRMVKTAYDKGLRNIHKTPLAVVSVGNLSLGGTGKTPMTILIADYYTSAKRKPAILTRGYGNDECRMLVDELPDVPVYTGQDRVKSALKASGDGHDIAILDDGFQHRRIARDLDIVLVDGRAPFGNGYIFPAGILREPPREIERADIIVITKTDTVLPERIKEIKTDIRAVAPGKPIVLSRHAPESFTDITGSSYGLDIVLGRQICLVCGLADPLYFESLIKDLGAQVKQKFFYPDHFRYTQKHMEEISAKCDALGIDCIVTTRKDIVKMRDLDMSRVENLLLVLNIKIAITEGKELLSAGLDSVSRAAAG